MTYLHLTVAALAGGLCAPSFLACRDNGRTPALSTVGRELAAAEYLHRSALNGDTVAQRYLRESRKRLCSALQQVGPLRLSGEEPVPMPFGEPVPLHTAYDAIPRLREAGRLAALQRP